MLFKLEKMHSTDKQYTTDHNTKQYTTDHNTKQYTTERNTKQYTTDRNTKQYTTDHNNKHTQYTAFPVMPMVVLVIKIFPRMYWNLWFIMEFYENDIQRSPET